MELSLQGSYKKIFNAELLVDLEVFGLKAGQLLKVEVYKSKIGFNVMASQFEKVNFFMNDTEENILKTIKIL